MLWYYVKEICYCTLFIMGVCFVCALYAFRVNARRDDDDPEKREFEFGAVFLAPFTWILLFPTSIVIAFLRAFLGMVFIALFAIGVIAVRKPFIIKLLEKFAAKIGGKLMVANTILLRAFLGKPIRLSK